MISAYANAAVALDAWMTAEGIDGDFTAALQTGDQKLAGQRLPDCPGLHQPGPDKHVASAWPDSGSDATPRFSITTLVGLRGSLRRLGNVPAAGHGRRGRERDRVGAGPTRVRGLVRAGAGHDPDRGTARGRAGGGRAGERRVRPVCAEPGQVGRFPGGSASQSGGGSICSGVSAGPRSRADTSAAGESGANMDSSCSSRFR